MAENRESQSAHGAGASGTLEQMEEVQLLQDILPSTSSTEPSDNVLQRLGKLKVPTKVKPRGRPKGAEKTVIGLPRRRQGLQKPATKLRPFRDLPSKEKELRILRCLIPQGPQKEVQQGKILLDEDQVETIPSRIPETILDQDVDLSSVQKYFTEDGWVAVLATRIENLIVVHINERFGHLLAAMNKHRGLTLAKLELCSQAVKDKGAPLDNCWGFVDRTARPCRPSKNQMPYFSGHKRVLVVKHQAVMCADGTCCAAVKKSQCATGGGVGDEPLNEMEERIVGLLNVESVEGIPGAFDIGVAPIHEVVVGVPFSLPLSGRYSCQAELSRASSLTRYSCQAELSKASSLTW
ncbi:hypothetical protein HPB47_000272 [Ixodes persulcatus]|uniref:Uncharacterized protein n=1 Tax=Ixodes persulcatus TaxID=34615 RepID=A0AC60PSA9_IXOPE|nr:hypothetical protein HPB47_000272 [Ixodes persulcatus]